MLADTPLTERPSLLISARMLSASQKSHTGAAASAFKAMAKRACDGTRSSPGRKFARSAATVAEISGRVLVAWCMRACIVGVGARR